MIEFNQQQRDNKEQANTGLSKAILQAFRNHCREHHYLRLHHAIYLHQIFANDKDPEQRYRQLSGWLQSALNRFFDLVDRVALSRCQCESRNQKFVNNPSWSQQDVSNLLEKGEEWIEELREQQLLVLKYDWGSGKTRESWAKLAANVDSVLHAKDLFKRRRKDLWGREKPKQYEIFSGGFEYVPVFGLFPFYLFGERLCAWSIFEYGKLNSLVLAMNDATRDRLKTDGFSLYTRVADRNYTMERTSFPALMDAVEAAGEDMSFYYIGAGHAAVSLTQRIVTLSDYWKLRANIKPLAGDVEALRSIFRQDSAEQKYGIVISDLGDPTLNDYLLQHANDKPPNLMTIDGLRVPVGVGFSLAALPLLLGTPKALDRLKAALDEWVDDGKRACTRAELTVHDGIVLHELDEIPSPFQKAASEAATAS